MVDTWPEVWWAGLHAIFEMQCAKVPYNGMKANFERSLNERRVMVSLLFLLSWWPDLIPILEIQFFFEDLILQPFGLGVALVKTIPWHYWMQFLSSVEEDILNIVNIFVLIFRKCWFQVNFSEATAAANTINAWIAKNTQGMIKDMLSSDSFSDATRLVLANAVYFKGNHPFMCMYSSFNALP